MLKHPHTCGDSNQKTTMHLFKYNITFIIFFFFLFLYVISGKLSSGEGNTVTNIVAILDIESRMGKEQKTAMEIAVDRFNNGDLTTSFHRRLSLTFMDFNVNLFQTVSAVQKYIKDNTAQVIIIGMENWQATTLVAQVGSQAQVPIISLASSNPMTSQFTSLQWPFLVQMSHNGTQQIHNLVAIIKAYNWRRVIVVYEDDLTSGDSSMLFLLTKELQNIGSQIEYQMLLPPSTSTTDFKGVIQKVLRNFITESCYSRVFVVVKVSLPFVNHLFHEAKGMELMGNDSAWIILEHVTNLLPYIDHPTLLDMEGVLGIMTKFDNSKKQFEEFQAQFWTSFSKEFPQVDDHEPSFHALLAYDTITAISNSIMSISVTSHNEISKEGFLRGILHSNFVGLSGHISFDQDHNTLRELSNTSVVNIIGRNYQEILEFASKDIEDDETIKELTRQITWPGNLVGMVPKGWRMPTQKKVMRIGVPVDHGYTNFNDYNRSKSDNCSFKDRNISYHNELFGGFCIKLFNEVLPLLSYSLPHEFIPCRDPYNVLIDHVHNKILDAVVGDVTILANRLDKVEFTLPFEESGLSIILPMVQSNYRGPWIFLKPFTLQMWLVTLAVLVYTMFVVWFLEHRENKDFRGPWRNQLSTTVWFTFSSLYFAQREKISSGLARVVVVTWMFIVMVLTQSYTANLSSMLTNERLNQTTIDIEMLRRSNAKVGYDKTSFVNKFIEDLFQFNASNIVGIDGGFEHFHKAFKDGNIKAAFLDVLYAELFASQYCNQYTITIPRYRYGGLAYVFPKGSPIATDVSQAILTLTENGKLMELEKKFLGTSNKCYINDDVTKDNDDQNSLSLKSFWILFVFSIATATICFMASLILSHITWSRITPSQSVANSN